MGNFDAGSIEAKLTLDRSQFKRELAAARADAKRFEDDGINVDANVQLDDSDAKVRLEEIKAEIASLHNAKIGVDVNKADAQAKLASLKKELELLRDRHVNIDVDAGRALGEIEAFQVELRKIPNKKTTKLDIDAGNGISRSQALVTAILAALPLIPAVAAPATAAVLGLSASLVAAGGGAAILGLGIFGAIKHIKDFNGHVTTMPASMRAFVAAQTAMTSAFDKFVTATQGQSFAILASGLNLITGILPRLVPIFNAFATVATGALSQLSTWVNGPAGAGVLRWFQTFGAQQFGMLLGIVGNLAQVILNLLQAFSPFATVMVGGLQRVTAAWVGWSATVAQSQGFRDFMAYVNQVGPMVINALVALGRAIINIGVALAPLGPPMLALITIIGNFIAALNPAILRIVVVSIIGLTAAFAAYEGIMKAVTAITTLWTAATTIAGVAQRAFNFLVVEGRVQTLAFAVVQGAVRAAILAWTAAQWLLNIALTANPIGIVIVLIAALVAAIVLAWRNSETFRNVVLAVWSAIKIGVGATISFLIGLLRQIGSDMATTWRQISSIVSTSVHAVTSAVSTAWNFVRNTTVSVWNAITGAVSSAWNAIRNAVTAAVNSVRNAVSSAWNAIRSTVTSVMSSVQSAVSSAWNSIRSTVSSVISNIRGVISSGLSAARSVAVSAFNGIRSAASSALGALGGIASRAAGAVRGVFAGAGGWLISAGRNIISGLISGIMSMLGSLGGALGGIGSFIASHKGPPSYDKVMLRPHGRWIMGGLIDSILSQVPRLGDAIGVVNGALNLNPAMTSAGTGASGMVGGGSGVSIVQHIYNPINEPTSVSATRGIKDLAVMGVFNRKP